MSQPDLVAEIRAAEVEAPAELRERVRLIAATAPPERRSLLHAGGAAASRCSSRSQLPSLSPSS